MTRYQRLCRRTNTKPLTVFISLTTVSSQGILSLLGDLDVTIPSKIRRRLLGGSDMGRESVRIASEVFGEVIEGVERDGVDVPLGRQIEQGGVNSARLSLGVLDGTYQLLKQA